jgi:hypothetical protein
MFSVARADHNLGNAKSSARSHLLRSRGLEPRGNGLEESGQLVELGRFQPVLRSFCEGVGQ